MYNVLAKTAEVIAVVSVRAAINSILHGVFCVRFLVAIGSFLDYGAAGERTAEPHHWRPRELVTRGTTMKAHFSQPCGGRRRAKFNERLFPSNADQ